MLNRKRGKEIEYEQAPCFDENGNPLGEISADGQQESKEGTCRCPRNLEGCCVDGYGIIIPRILKKDPKN